MKQENLSLMVLSFKTNNALSITAKYPIFISSLKFHFFNILFLLFEYLILNNYIINDIIINQR